MAKRRFGKVSWIAITRDLVRINLDQLERCTEEVQETLVTRLREFERHVDARAKSLEAEAREEWPSRARSTSPRPMPSGW